MVARMPSRALACLAIAVAAVAWRVRPAPAAGRDWIGSAACGACHPGELAAWQVTPHATTRARFASRGGPRATDGEARCLACHATGEAPAGPVVAVEVGCEACHGAGAAYAEDDLMRDRPVARALGLTDVSTPQARAAVCAGCHRSATRGTPFDPTAPVHPR